MAEGKEGLTGQIMVIVEPPGRLVMIDQGQLTLGQGPGDWQPAGGIILSEEHFGDGMAALLTGIP